MKPTTFLLSSVALVTVLVLCDNTDAKEIEKRLFGDIPDFVEDTAIEDHDVAYAKKNDKRLIGEFVSFFESLGSDIASVATDFASVVVDAAEEVASVAEDVGSEIASVAEDVGSGVVLAAEEVASFAVDAGNDIASFGEDVGSELESFGEDVASAVVDAAEEVAEVAEDVGEAVVDVAEDIGEAIEDAFNAASDFVKDQVDALIEFGYDVVAFAKKIGKMSIIEIFSAIGKYIYDTVKGVYEGIRMTIKLLANFDETAELLLALLKEAGIAVGCMVICRAASAVLFTSFILAAVVGELCEMLCPYVISLLEEAF